MKKSSAKKILMRKTKETPTKTKIRFTSCTCSGEVFLAFLNQRQSNGFGLMITREQIRNFLFLHGGYLAPDSDSVEIDDFARHIELFIKQCLTAQEEFRILQDEKQEKKTPRP